jgi:TonB family protein
MMRAFGILTIALALLLSMSGKVFAQLDSNARIEVSFQITEPREIIPLDDLIHYPEIAREKGIEGNVIMSAKVNEDGSTSQVEVVRSDNPVFNDEAIRVLTTARFDPAIQLGKPCPFWPILTIHFRLNVKAAPYLECGNVDFEEPRLLTTTLDSCIHYPELAREKGLEAKVTIKALVETDGSISNMVILWPLDDTIFTPEAVRIMKAAHFRPEMQNDKAVPAWITRTINFRLKDKAKE